MNDTEILEWIARNVYFIGQPIDGFEIGYYAKNGSIDKTICPKIGTEESELECLRRAITQAKKESVKNGTQTIENR